MSASQFSQTMIIMLLIILESNASSIISKTASINPNKLHDNGATITQLNTIISSNPLQWKLHANTTEGFHLQLTLNRSWQFHPTQPTTLVLQIYAGNTNSSNNTHSLLVAVQQTGSNQYFATKIVIDKGTDHYMIPNFVTDPPYPSYLHADIKYILQNNTNPFRHSALSNGSYEAYKPSLIATDRHIESPLTFTLQNNPSTESILYSYNNPNTAVRSCGFTPAMSWNSALNIYFAADWYPDDTVDISSIAVTLIHSHNICVSSNYWAPLDGIYVWVLFNADMNTPVYFCQGCNGDAGVYVFGWRSNDGTAFWVIGDDYAVSAGWSLCTLDSVANAIDYIFDLKDCNAWQYADSRTDSAWKTDSNVNVLKCVTPSPTLFTSKTPTLFPTGTPTETQTKSPSNNPTEFPSVNPTEFPSVNPTFFPTEIPTATPTKSPSNNPTEFPSKNPTFTTTTTSIPTEIPSSPPSISISMNPTTSPSDAATIAPTDNPTNVPSLQPSMGLTESTALYSSNDSISSGVTFIDNNFVLVVAVALLCVVCLCFCVLFVYGMRRKKKVEVSLPSSAVQMAEIYSSSDLNEYVKEPEKQINIIYSNDITDIVNINANVDKITDDGMMDIVYKYTENELKQIRKSIDVDAIQLDEDNIASNGILTNEGNDIKSNMNETNDDKNVNTMGEGDGGYY